LTFVYLNIIKFSFEFDKKKIFLDLIEIMIQINEIILFNFLFNYNLNENNDKVIFTL
jgi:hypothetical protein